MKVLLCALADYANVGGMTAYALRSVGVDAWMFMVNPHPFNYRNQGTLLTQQNLREFLHYGHDADVVQHLHSQYLPYTKKFPGQQAVFHGGTMYREHPDQVNAFFNPRVGLSLTQTTEMLDTGATNEVHWIPPVDFDRLSPGPYIQGDIQFGHYPSDPTKKGTKTIVQAMKEMDLLDQFVHDLRQVPYHENLGRIRTCDVYIEKQAYYYDFSLTALEAGAMRRIVITDGDYQPEDCPFYFANSPDELKEAIETILSLTPTQLHATQDATREWVANRYHPQLKGWELRQLYREHLLGGTV